jgi:hypothetical protein
MKRNQKKFSRKNYKGGVVDSNMAKISLSALKKRLEDIELNIDTIKAKMGEINPVEGPSREDNTRFEEAGYPEEKPVVEQNNPNIPDFVSSQSTSEKIYNGSTPITDAQYAEVDRLNEEIKKLQSNPNKFNREKLKTLTGLKNALFAKYQKRVDYLENAQRATPLTQDEIDELRNLKFNLDPNEPLGGGRKSRRHRKSKRSTRRKRTRKYRK